MRLCLDYTSGDTTPFPLLLRAVAAEKALGVIAKLRRFLSGRD